MRTNITDKWEKKGLGLLGTIRTNPDHTMGFTTVKRGMVLGDIAKKLNFVGSVGLVYNRKMPRNPDFKYDKKLKKKIEWIDPGGEWFYPSFDAPAIYRVDNRVWVLAPTWNV